MTNYYFKTLELIEDAKYKATYCILYEFKLYSLALYLKNKFNDKRSVPQLIDLLVEVYDLKHKTSRFLTRSFLYN